MKIFLRFLSYTVLIFVFVFSFPLSESLKFKNVSLKKKILERINTETVVSDTILKDGEESSAESAETEETEELETVTVQRIIDGDTIVTEDGKKIRLIGVNTPEKYQRFGFEAASKTKELVLGKEIFLEFDKDREDDYGRLLAYVFTDDYFVNYELLRSGFAYLMIIKPNTKYSNEFKKALAEAKNNKLGLWKGK